MLKTVKAGKAINEEDIPPQVLVKTKEKDDQSITPEQPKNFPISPQKSENYPIVPSSNSLNSPREELPPSVPKEAPSSEPHPSNTIPQKLAFPPPVDTHRLRLDVNTDKLFDNIQPAVPPQLPAKPQAEKISTDSTDSMINLLNTRHNQYKFAALKAKKAGDKETAVTYMRMFKHIETLITAIQNGEEIDSNLIPPVPDSADDANTVTNANMPTSQSNTTATPESTSQENNTSSSKESETPVTTLEALEQRLAKYVEQRDKAKSQDNSRKVRMNERIIKQYQEAIKLYQLGRHVEFDELPTPPGFPPIPPINSPNNNKASTTPAAPPSQQVSRPAPAVPTTANANAPTPAPAPKAPAPAPPTAASGKNLRRTTSQSRVEKQLAFLLKRQQQFKKAALEAKKKGEIEQAKEYLRNCKGFDQLIEASRNGLPVDLNTVSYLKFLLL